MGTFTEQVILITGASGNLGEATTRAFHQAGAKLILFDRRREKLEATFADLFDADKIRYTAVDLTDDDAVKTAVNAAMQQFEHIDAVINIAGGFKMGPLVHETSLDTWDFMLNLNARSVFFMARAIVPHMLQQGYGKIVNVAARAGLEGKAKMGAYVVSKSAVIRLTETLSAELKDQGINVNCVLPGTIDTPPNREAMPAADFTKWVSPAALADVILFLASDAARAVTGAAIPVYGRS